MLCWIEIRSSQHIKKNYCSNMNVCVGTLKKSHTGRNDRGKCCGILRTWQDRQTRRKNVTQVTEFSFSKIF
ncbi:hypothetical protein DN595_13455 [Enterobacter cloacae]|uniref:Uncharacterized protein n=1 Tax=Enterobacter cloacae TaxID=550 RepID=A0AB37VI52_ENTCL|nr:hypothetical protein EKN83_15855 [Enterobacter sp. WCHEn090032]RWT78383.1 hypothetical protein DN595_13455 [Enterobacter cloacae]